MSEEKKETAREIIENTLPRLEDGKRYHVQQAQQYGVAKDVLETLLKVPDPQLNQHTVGFSRFRAFVEESAKDQVQRNVSSGAIAMAGTATVMPTVGMAPLGMLQQPLIWAVRTANVWDERSVEECATKLAKLDPELGRLFRGLGEAFWAMTENPERTAFGLARQCFDHLFSLLAPDDAVRASPFFSKKEEGDPNRVWRMERLRYAAARSVPDQSRAEFLVEQGREFLNNYRDLQELHKRGQIQRDSARAILQTFIAMIQQWVDGLTL